MTPRAVGWTRLALGDALEALIDYRGKTPAKLGGDWAPAGVPVISAMNVKGGQISFDRNRRFVDEALAAAWMKSPLRAGDLLMTSEAPLGELALVPDHRPLVLGQRLFALRGRESLLDNRFLALWLTSPDGRGQLQGRASGTTVTGIRQAELLKLQVPLPPLIEQRRIVDTLEDHLSRLDAASGELASVRTRLAGMLRAARHAVSTRGVYETVPLVSLVSRIEAGRSFGSAARAADDGEWGIVKVSAMTWGAFNETENKAVLDPSRVDERFEIKPGDLLLSRANTSAYVGASVLVGSCRPRLLLSDKSLRLVPHDGVDPHFLCAVLQAPSARSQMSDLATGTKDSMRNISQAALLSIQLPKATPAQQAKVVQEVAAVEEQVGRLRVAVERTQARHKGLRRSLLDAAFAGRL